MWRLVTAMFVRGPKALRRKVASTGCDVFWHAVAILLTCFALLVTDMFSLPRSDGEVLSATKGYWVLGFAPVFE